MHSLLVVAAIVGGVLVAVALFVARRLKLEEAGLAREARIAATEKEVGAARRQAAQAEADRQFLGRVLRELPHLTQQLHAGAGGRQTAKLLLSAVVRLLEPKKAAVAVRRRQAESDPDRHLRLAVAATTAEDVLPVGTEFAIGAGEIGYAAEVQRAMDRRDFESQPAATRKRLRDETTPGCQPDVVAPMIFDDEVMGVIAVEGVKRASDAKDVLRLIAQLGAVSMHTQARYTEMTATASVDGLTGIFNKRYLTHRLADEIRRAVDEASPLSVFLFDLDNFKHYNDRNGHVAGDRVLQRLARLIRENVRTDSTLGRYGGEEFLLIFPGTRRAQALAAAENVRSAVAAHEFPFGFGQPLGVVSISGGVAECPADGADAATLVRAADEALYRAKDAGRNRVLAHEPRYIGGDEAQTPVEIEVDEDVPAPGLDTPPPADLTPAPGVLFALASVTPAAGIPRMTLQPTAEVLAAAAAGTAATSTPAAVAALPNSAHEGDDPIPSGVGRGRAVG
jgi:diguanylate cyclase (GGDEF)-like protein